MNPIVYQVERSGRITTVKSHAGPLGVALGLYPDARKGVSWQTAGKITTVSPDITVKEIFIPLSWVKWCPQR